MPGKPDKPGRYTQLGFRLPKRLAVDLKKALIDQNIGLQHFMETVAGVMVDFNRGGTDPRTATEFRRLIARALEAKIY